MAPLGQGFPSPATMLFNCLARGIMPIINRPPVGIDNYQEHYEAIGKRQMKDDKATSKSYVCMPIGSTAVVQQEDGGPWTHSTIEGKGNHVRSYLICITKTGRLVTQNRQNVKPTQISAE